jgi:hypothetical protein
LEQKGEFMKYEDGDLINYVSKYQTENGYSKRIMAGLLDISYNTYCKIIREERIPSSSSWSFKNFYRTEEEKKQFINNKTNYGLECNNNELRELKELYALFVKHKSETSFKHVFTDEFLYSEKDNCFALRLIQKYGIVIKDFYYHYWHKFDAADSYSETTIEFSYKVEDIDKLINYIDSLNI